MVFGKRKREKGRRMAAAVFPILDEAEAYSWAWRVEAEKSGDEAASAKYPPMLLEESVERMLPLCDNDPNTLLEVIQAWAEVRADQFDDDRGGHLTGMQMGYLTGIGNLFGLVSEDHPLAGDPRLADEGRRRGWRG